MVVQPGRFVRDRPGAAAVELAAVLPVFLTLLLGLWEVGRIADVRQILGNAAREGARQASAGQISDAQVAQVAIAYVKNSGLKNAVPSFTNVVATVQNLTNPGTDSTKAAQLDRIRVTVTIPFGDVRLVNASLISGGTTLLTGQAVLCSMKDKPFPTENEPPIE